MDLTGCEIRVGRCNRDSRCLDGSVSGGSSSLLAGPVVRKTLSRLCLFLSVELQVILQHKNVSELAVDNAGDQSVFLRTASAEIQIPDCPQATPLRQCFNHGDVHHLHHVHQGFGMILN